MFIKVCISTPSQTVMPMLSLFHIFMYPLGECDTMHNVQTHMHVFFQRHGVCAHVSRVALNESYVLEYQKRTSTCLVFAAAINHRFSCARYVYL